MKSDSTNSSGRVLIIPPELLMRSLFGNAWRATQDCRAMHRISPITILLKRIIVQSPDRFRKSQSANSALLVLRVTVLMPARQVVIAQPTIERRGRDAQ